MQLSESENVFILALVYTRAAAASFSADAYLAS